MRKFSLAFLFAALLANAQSQTSKKLISFKSTDQFDQEFHEAYPIGKTPEENNVRSIAVDKKNTVYIATALGIFKKENAEKTWLPITFQEEDKGPAYSVAIDEAQHVWLGTWNGFYFFDGKEIKKISGTKGPISVICLAKEGVYALGPNGVWLCNNNNDCIKKNYSIARSVRSAISDNKEGLWVATDVGLYHADKNKTTYYHKTDLLISAALKGLSMNGENLWAAGLGGISIIKNAKRERIITPAQGCPTIHTTCIKKSGDGTMWLGTKSGVVRFYPNGKHSLRFSRRWLLDDHVNDIAFDEEGNAWIATAQGVSAIKKKKMSLENKQEYFYDVLMRRHIREPWIAGQCHLPIAGDTTKYEPEDDDNDGEYTGNYLAMESFHYAVTKSEDVRAKAKKAFHFLQQLREITNGDGYFARTMVPIEWEQRVHDGNQTYSEKEKAEELVNEPRFKPVEIRWHKSADGKWLWKGDASSDEWCGHFMGYYFYYELAADEEEKILVRKHIATLVDHLIAHNFNMMDADGTATRWSVWSPQSLNHDDEWMPDKSENSMELLAFLKLAYHVTGDEKYETHYLTLINKEHYLENMAAIGEQNPAWFIYYDVMMQAYIYPILLRCEKNPKLLAFYQQHMDQWMARRKNDHNPLINFLYCYATHKKIEEKNSVDFLIDTPLDLVDWHINHTKREDIKLQHAPVLDEWEVNELQPPSMRATVRWDTNLWVAVNGSPSVEKEPVFWLYPYWLGRYLKIIE